MEMQYDFWFWFFFGIVLLIVSTQTVTTWFVFHSFSQLNKGALRNFQSIAFCGIISLVIIGSAFIGKTQIAVGGAVLEVLINWFYYAKEFFEDGYKSFSGDKVERRKKRRNSTLKFWRKYWLKMLFGIIIPAGIYICSELMVLISKGEI
jgi:hypothetical protein